MAEARAARRAERARIADAQRAIETLSSTGNAAVDAARKHFVAYQRDCSGFVRAVAWELRAASGLGGNADAQIDYMRGAWERVSREESIARSERGELVVAGLRSNEHAVPRSNGHVAVVAPGELYREQYPRVWSGSLGGIVGQSEGDRSVGQIWRIDDRDRVEYFAAPRRAQEDR